VAARFPQAGLATPHYLASAAGAAELGRGGNAVDAIVAANLALGVVAPYLCGYGGDLFAIVWDGELHGYLGSGRSPAAAELDTVRERLGEIPLWVGPHTVTVPGAVAGWFALLERWGTRSFGDLAQDAIRYARDGFELTPMGAASCTAFGGIYQGCDDWQALYGSLEPGDVLRQPALAGLIGHLAEKGPVGYYEGEVAAAIAAAVQRGGGLLEPTDLAAHLGEWVAPLRAAYRDVEIAELPPPTQGTAALEILRILDGFDLRALDPAERTHLVIEAVKLGLRDREEHLTDPAHMRLAAEDLLAPAWIEERRAAIDPDRARIPEPGRPQRGGTAYLCAADGDGLLVSLIQSNFTGFGSGVHVPEWGINLNNRGASFALDPDRVNVLAPSKRPMHTLIPAMMLRDGRPSVVFGTMGADAQAQVHAQVVTQLVDDGADAQVALNTPRWRVEIGDWKLRVERRMDPAVLADLASRGHELIETVDYDPGMGHAHAITLGPGGYGVATDPRAEGAAVGR
jgi:gamma-glutamyltranspeptidase/glutathione hydrolase